MRRSSVLLTLFLLYCTALYAQQPTSYAFQINGTINADTGTVKLSVLVSPDLYPEHLRNLTAKVKNKQFYFTGYLPSPQSFQLEYSSGYYSDSFIIQAGAQSIRINVDSSRHVPQVGNLVMKEYYGEYTDAFKQVRRKRDRLDNRWDSLNLVFDRKLPDALLLSLHQELKKYYRESDQALFNYVKAHPNSYVAFWQLIRLLPFGYEPLFDTIFYEFSPLLRTSYAGKVYAEKLRAARVLRIGSVFPAFTVVNQQEQPFTTTALIKGKYILLDFWYSGCSPCREQFPALKKIYEQYKGKGLEMIGVSTDKIADKKKWQVVIEKDQLSWPQYWDRNGKAAKELSITAFPTTLLLDSEGKIIKMDVKPVELAQFLLENSY